jgi:flagella basal body P-ring formation protein FlgA
VLAREHANPVRTLSLAGWIVATIGVVTPVAVAQDAFAGDASAAQSAPLVIPTESETLRLRPAAHVVGDVIRASDVLDLSQAGDELRAACGRIVIENARGPATVEIAFDRVADALAQSGVNLGRVMISGAAACRVDVLPADKPAVGESDAADSTTEPARSTASSIAADDRSLAAAVRRAVQEEFGQARGAIEIAFERGSGDFLDLSSPQFDFSVRSGSRGQLGLREFKVRISQDGRVQRTVSVFGRVRLLRQVVVAAKPLNIGAYIRPDAIRLAPRLFENAADLGIADEKEVIGQRVDRFVAAGEMLTRGDVKPVDLVQRSRPVTVTSDGSVALRLTGTALQSGSFGDRVRVRLGSARDKGREVTCEVTGMAAVRLIQDEPAELASAAGGR